MPELPTLTGRHDAWPFFRADPTPVILGVRPGATPSSLPPVRIFLGTEEAQYRAERIFFYSIEKVRDPGRVYEIHLMKNVAGRTADDGAPFAAVARAVDVDHEALVCRRRGT